MVALESTVCYDYFGSKMIRYPSPLNVLKPLFLLAFLCSPAFGEEGICIKAKTSDLVGIDTPKESGGLTEVTQEILPCAMAENGEFGSTCLNVPFYMVSEKGGLFCLIPIWRLNLSTDRVSEYPENAVASISMNSNIGLNSFSFIQFYPAYAAVNSHFEQVLEPRLNQHLLVPITPD